MSVVSTTPATRVRIFRVAWETGTRYFDSRDEAESFIDTAEYVDAEYEKASDGRMQPRWTADRRPEVEEVVAVLEEPAAV